MSADMPRPRPHKIATKDLWIATVSDPIVQLAAWEAKETSVPEQEVKKLTWHWPWLKDVLHRLVLAMFGKRL
jgi:hypothetical protein